MRCIANIDFFPKDLSANDYFKIMDKWHPKHWGCSYRFVADPDKNTEARYVSLLVPVIEDNLIWHRENPECKYIQDIAKYGKKAKALPVALAEKEVVKFLNKLGVFVMDGESSLKIKSPISASL